MKKCDYCLQDNSEDRKTCKFCGAEIVDKKSADIWRSAPFLYNGYVVYLTQNYCANTLSCSFWLGDKLVETFEISIEALRQLVPEGEDTVHFFWKLLEVAQGTEEVLRIKEQNSKYPAMFEIRRIENPELARWGSMNVLDIAQEVRR